MLSVIWQWLGYCRRLFGAASSFFIFGLGGLIFSSLVYPLLLVGSRKERRQRHTQVIIFYMFKYYVGYLQWVGVLNLTIEGDLKSLQSSHIIVANHPSLLDVVFILSLIPKAYCVVKGALFKSIYTVGPITSAGYIPNEDPDVLFERSKAALLTGVPLVLFPEGTRTTPNQEIVFHKTAVRIAIETQTDIKPILIFCEPSALSKTNKWYDIAAIKPTFRLVILDKWSCPEYEGVSYFRKVQHINIALENFIKEELVKHA